MSDYTVIDNSFTDGIQPDDVKLTMQSHQLKVFKKCLELENNDIIYQNQTEEDKEIKLKITTNIGIIGSPVGSGKSLIIMTLMSTNYTKQNKKYLSDMNMNINDYEKYLIKKRIIREINYIDINMSNDVWNVSNCMYVMYVTIILSLLVVSFWC